MALKLDYASSSLGDDELEDAFEASLRGLRGSPSPIEPHLIGDRRIESGELFERFDPCLANVRVGAACEASDALVEAAVCSAKEAFRSWRTADFSERVARLRAAGAEVGRELVAIAAVVSAETGKTRLEALGEVQEVIDMIEHYCSLMQHNNGYLATLKSTKTEKNYDVLVPYGVFAVISPFNFPVALMVGMTVSALVTGNTVVVKPSDKTPRSTATIAEVLRNHLPVGVLNLVHGGAGVGSALAATDVDGIAFTGSAEVGWKLVQSTRPSGLPRPVLAEMGGQNPTIVAASADLDAAVAGIIRSAFGLSGQKCSACRRAIVVEEVADALTDRLVDAAKSLKVGDPLDGATDLGPVVDDAIARRLDAANATAELDGSVLTGGRLTDLEGNFYSPVIACGLPRGHALTRQELFAPFLTVVQVQSFDDAIDEANAVHYGLSAGLFSADAQEIDRFIDDIQAGVIYVNRAASATTGAWPGVQSFCGWKRSGSVGKGGLGYWYLPGFMKEQSRTIVTER